MIGPGSNLLAAALTVIPAQAATYRRWAGSTTNAAGRTAATYDAPVTLYGSMQPVPATRMAMLGLDMTKAYSVFYASRRFLEPGRDDCAGDLLDYDGRRWQSVSKTGWFAVDGWDALLTVDVGPTP